MPGDHQQLLEQLRATAAARTSARAAAAPAPGSRGRPRASTGSASGVSISTKSRVGQHLAGDPVGLGAHPHAPGPGPGGAGRGSGSAAGPPRRPRRARRSGTAAARDSVSTSTSSAMTSIAPVARSGFSLPSGRSATSPVTCRQNSLRSGCATSALADDDLADARSVAQVEEGDPAVVAAAGDPAGQGDGRARVLGAQRAGLVRADHDSIPSPRSQRSQVLDGPVDRPTWLCPPSAGP